MTLQVLEAHLWQLSLIALYRCDNLPHYLVHAMRNVVCDPPMNVYTVTSCCTVAVCRLSLMHTYVHAPLIHVDDPFRCLADKHCVGA